MAGTAQSCAISHGLGRREFANYPRLSQPPPRGRLRLVGEGRRRPARKIWRLKMATTDMAFRQVRAAGARRIGSRAFPARPCAARRCGSLAGASQKPAAASWRCGPSWPGPERHVDVPAQSSPASSAPRRGETARGGRSSSPSATGVARDAYRWLRRHRLPRRRRTEGRSAADPGRDGGRNRATTRSPRATWAPRA